LQKGGGGEKTIPEIIMSYFRIDGGKRVDQRNRKKEGTAGVAKEQKRRGNSFWVILRGQKDAQR